MADSFTTFADLADDLGELFGEMVTVEGGEQRQLGGAELSIVQMGYSRRTSTGDGPARTTHIRQTVLVCKDAELDLPQFALSPTPKGIGGALLSLFGDMGDINFTDSPAFSDEYHLHGWSEQPVRLLFTKPIRDYFARNLGWSVLGKNQMIALFQHNHVVDQSEHQRFVKDALSILTLFQQGEERLDSMPEIRREATPSDITATAQRMGLVGTMLVRQLKKLSVTRKDLENFLAQGRPRVIPSGIKRQVLGNNLVLAIFGALFFFAGLVGGALVLGLAEGSDRLIGLPFLILFPLIGGAMMYFTLRHRGRKRRTLRHGEMVRARVTDVRGTSTAVNNQRRYHVSVEYSQGGKNRANVVHAYGPAVDRAREYEQNGELMRVLVDPQDSDHLVGIDLLMIFDDP